MSLGITKNVIRLVILIMAFECISAALTPVTANDTGNAATFKKPSVSSLLSSVVLEKTEEEQKGEEETDKFTTTILVDFSRVAFELSHVHTTNIRDISLLQPFNIERSLFRLFCTFII
jgi:hypothetical protein